MTNGCLQGKLQDPGTQIIQDADCDENGGEERLYCVKWPAWAETSGNIIRNASFTFGKGLMALWLEINYNDDDDDDEKEDFLIMITVTAMTDMLTLRIGLTVLQLELPRMSITTEKPSSRTSSLGKKRHVSISSSGCDIRQRKYDVKLEHSP